MARTVDARDTLSEMTETAEVMLSSIFARDRARDIALYRECPTAFWLAPDADLSVEPTAPPADILVSPNVRPPSETPDEVTGINSAILHAMIAAGPVFAAAWLAIESGQTGDSWWEPLARAGLSVMLAPFTVLVGAVLGVIPILVGTMMLGEGGTHLIWLRKRGAWLATGAAMGTAIAALVGADAGAGLALIVTSVACATIARHAVDWNEPEFA